MSETVRQIKAFQLVRQTEGAEVTPSGWQPGKKTLKPGPDLVEMSGRNGRLAML